MWSPKGTTLRVIKCPTLQVSQFLFPGQRSDTFLTDHVYNPFTLQMNFLCKDDLKYFGKMFAVLYTVNLCMCIYAVFHILLSL